MPKLFEIAAQVATPLGVAGIAVIVFFLVYRQLIKGPLAAQLSRSHSFHVFNRMVTFVFILGLVAIVFSIIAFVVVKLQPSPIVEEPRGFLSPGNASTPPNPCGPPGPGQFVLLAGGNAVVAPRGVRHYLTILLNQRPLVWITDDEQGISISAEVRRDDGRETATLRDNRFTINTNNYYELQRPNRHEFTVIDESGTVVLHAEFLNEQAFRIQGHFAQPGYGKAIIRADDLTLLIPGRPTITNNCAAYNGAGGFSF